MDPTIPQRGWWSRNWKWFVPVGCFSLLATCGCCIGGGFLVAMKGIQNSAVYQDAIAKAKSSPQVIEALGAPIEPSWMMELNIRDSETRIRVPLQGSKSAGTLYVQATQSDRGIHYDRLHLVTGGKTIDLADPDGAPEPADAPDVPEEPGEPEDDEPSDLTVEVRTDRPGSDYREYALTDPDPAQCALDCSEDEKCLAYTYVKPTGEEKPRCRLKSAVPPKVRSDCCVSGIKQ
jgi:hypothetical protein